jgi:phage shock protein C
MSVRHTRFYLDKQNAKFLGVCAGIADYTGISRLWVRVGFIVVTLLGAVPWTLLAYFITAWVADPKPRELAELDPDEARFWQGVRASPGRTVRDVRASFRDIDRRLADIEAHVTSSGARLAREIDRLR